MDGQIFPSEISPVILCKVCGLLLLYAFSVFLIDPLLFGLITLFLSLLCNDSSTFFITLSLLLLGPKWPQPSTTALLSFQLLMLVQSPLQKSLIFTFSFADPFPQLLLRGNIKKDHNHYIKHALGGSLEKNGKSYRDVINKIKWSSILIINKCPIILMFYIKYQCM